MSPFYFPTVTAGNPLHPATGIPHYFVNKYPPSFTFPLSASYLCTGKGNAHTLLIFIPAVTKKASKPKLHTPKWFLKWFLNAFYGALFSHFSLNVSGYS